MAEKRKPRDLWITMRKDQRCSGISGTVYVYEKPPDPAWVERVQAQGREVIHVREVLEDGDGD